GRAFKFKIGRPAIAGFHAEWESAGPAIQSVEAPSAEDAIQELVTSASPMPAVAKRQIPDPVGIQLVSGVVVRRGAPQIGRKCVDYLTVESQAAGLESIHPLGVRPNVDGLRVGVVQIELEARRHAVPQRHLQSVVIAVTATLPTVEG